jgi:hypothetical protein
MSSADLPDDRDQLRRVVESMHSCQAQFVQAVPVQETFKDQLVWEGTVHVFDLEDHPTATRAYAWSSPIEGSAKRRFFAVLHAGGIRSPADAVRAAIVAEYRRSSL